MVSKGMESHWQEAERALVLARLRIKTLEAALRTHEHIEREGCRLCDVLEEE